MTGSKGKSGSVSDFLGDDDWMNEDDPSEEVPAGHRPAPVASTPVVEAPVVEAPVAEASAVETPTPVADGVEAEAPPTIFALSTDDPSDVPDEAGDTVAEDAPAVEAVAGDGAWAPTPLGAWAPVSSPPAAPPASSALGWTAWLEPASSGLLATDETVAAAWRTVLPVLEAEAADMPDTLVLAARLALDLVGDVDAATALLARSGTTGSAAAAHVGTAIGGPARARAWAERAGTLEGSAAAEAWRAAAQGVGDPGLRTRFLHAAVEADPTDVRAAELLVATPGSGDDAAATLAAWSVLAAQRPPAGALLAERTLAARTFASGDSAAALGIVERALACHGDDAGLRALAERFRASTGDHADNAAAWRARGDAALAEGRAVAAALAYTYAAEAFAQAQDVDGAAACSEQAIRAGYLEMGMASVEAARGSGDAEATATAAALLAEASGQESHRVVAALAAEIAGLSTASDLWAAAGDGADALAGRARMAAARGEDGGTVSPRRAAESGLIAARLAGDVTALPPLLDALAEVVDARSAGFARAEAAFLRYALGAGAEGLASVEVSDGEGFTAWLQAAAMLAMGDRAAAAGRFAASGSADDLYRAALLSRGSASAVTWLESALALAPGFEEAERLLGELAGARRPAAFLAALAAEGVEASSAAARWLLGHDEASPYAADAPTDVGLLWAAASGDDGAFDAVTARRLADDDAAERRLAAGGSAAWRLAASPRTGFRIAQILRDRDGLAAWTERAADDAAWSAFTEGLADATPAEAAVRLRAAAGWGGDAWGAATQAAAALAEAEGTGDIAASLALRPAQPELAREGLRRALVAGEGAAWAAAHGDAVDRAVAASGAAEGAAAAWREVGGVVGALGVVASTLGGDDADHAAAIAALEPSTDAGRAWRFAQLRRLYSGPLKGSDGAWTFFGTLAASRPDDVEVQETVAELAGLRGDVEGAVHALSAIAAATSAPADAARVQRRIGDVYARGGRYADAEASYLSALDHDPGDVDALDGLENIALGLGDIPGLLRILQRRAHLVEGDARVEVLHRVARTTEKHLDADAAIEAWRAALVAGGDATEAAERLLAIVGDGRRFLEVAGWVEGVLEGRARAHLLTRMARVELAAQREEDAIAHLESAVSGEELDADGASLLVSLYNERGDHAGAERVLAALTAAAPSAEAWLGLARLRQSRKADVEETAAAYQGVLACDPQNAEALAFLGDWHYENGRLDVALPFFERRSATIEEGADLTDFDVRLEVATFWRRLAAMLVGAKRTDEAVLAYRSCLRFNPNDAPTLEAIAPLWVDQGAWAEAGDVLERLLALSGGQGEPARIGRLYQLLGEVDVANGNIERAYKRFVKATELDAANVRAWFGLAAILRGRGNNQELMRVYNQVINHASETDDLVRACLEKGEFLDVVGKLDKAVQHYERALDWAPERADVWVKMAEAKIRMEQMEAARDAARQGLAAADVVGVTAAKLHAVAWLASESLQDTGSAEASRRAAEEADATLVASLGSGSWQSRAEALRAAVTR